VSGSRASIARDLLAADLIADYDDYCAVARAMEHGESKDAILYAMSEVERWPGVFSFLQQRL